METDAQRLNAVIMEVARYVDDKRYKEGRDGAIRLYRRCSELAYPHAVENLERLLQNYPPVNDSQLTLVSSGG